MFYYTFNQMNPMTTPSLNTFLPSTLGWPGTSYAHQASPKLIEILITFSYVSPTPMDLFSFSQLVPSQFQYHSKKCLFLP